jgi:hypothetical protein
MPAELPSGRYWTERTLAFWFAADGSPVAWRPLSFDAAGGACDACGHEDLLYRFHVSSPGRPDSVLGSVCVTRLGRWLKDAATGGNFDVFGVFLRASGDIRLAYMHREARKNARALLDDPRVKYDYVQRADGFGFDNTSVVLEAMLSSPSEPSRKLVRFINERLKKLGIGPLEALGAGAE